MIVHGPFRDIQDLTDFPGCLAQGAQLHDFEFPYRQSYGRWFGQHWRERDEEQRAQVLQDVLQHTVLIVQFQCENFAIGPRQADCAAQVIFFVVKRLRPAVFHPVILKRTPHERCLREGFPAPEKWQHGLVAVFGYRIICAEIVLIFLIPSRCEVVDKKGFE